MTQPLSLLSPPAELQLGRSSLICPLPVSANPVCSPDVTTSPLAKLIASSTAAGIDVEVAGKCSGLTWERGSELPGIAGVYQRLASDFCWLSRGYAYDLSRPSGRRKSEYPCGAEPRPPVAFHTCGQDARPFIFLECPTKSPATAPPNNRRDRNPQLP